MAILIQVLISLLVFGSTFLLVWSLFGHPVNTAAPVHRQIALAVGTGERRTMFENRTFTPIINLALAIAHRLSFPWVRQVIRRDLDGSGNPNGYIVDEFLAICLIMSVALSLVSTILAFLLMPVTAPLTAAVMAGLGFACPLWSLHRDASARLIRISKKLPYTLDLLALLMTAGCTFTDAVESVVADEPDDDLNQELRLMRSEIEYGTRRADALSNLAGRIRLDSLRSVVGAVNQSESLGTPLSIILQAQAGMIRMQRSVRAEQLSASASLRILLPSTLILVAAVLVVFAPFLRPLLGRLLS